MVDLVPPAQIEDIVGHPRERIVHLGRWVTSESTIYILHSYGCVKNTSDLRKCAFSLALDEGIDFFDPDVVCLLSINDNGLLQGARCHDHQGNAS